MAGARDASLLFSDQIRLQAKKTVSIPAFRIFHIFCLIQTSDEELLPADIIIPVMIRAGYCAASPAIHMLIVPHTIGI